MGDSDDDSSEGQYTSYPRNLWLGLSLPEEEPGALYFVFKKWAFVSPAFSARLVVIQS